MEIVNVGYNYRHPQGFFIDRPHGSGDYMLLIIKSPAFALLSKKRTLIPQNSAIIFNKGTPQFYGSLEGEYVDDWIHFELGKEEKDFLKELCVPFDTVIPLGNATEFSSFIKNMFSERYSQNPNKNAAMKCYFDLILLKLSERITGPFPENEHRYFEAFSNLRSEIYRSPEKNWSIDEISKKITLSRSYVQHLYKSFFGVSIVSDVQHSRIEYAKYLLASGSITVSEISSLCGYKNDVHFMRLFKSAVGSSPTSFRNSCRISPDEIRKSKSKNPFNK